MSALTKVFVVLLVIGSLLLSASIIVFVNRAEDFAAANRTLSGELEADRARMQAAVADAAAARAARDRAIDQANQQTIQFREAQRNLQQQIAERDARVAQLETQITMLSADVTRLTDALNTSQGTTSHLQQHVTELRRANDEFLRRTSELNVAVSDLTNRLDQTERQRRFLAEQLQEAEGQVERLTAIALDAGIDLREPRPAGVRAGAPRITGRVQQVQTIAGIEYATINVGSADGVTREMQFQVVDTARGEWLGTLEVDRVDSHQAVGRLQGPRVDQVRPGVAVQTQL